MEPITVLSPHYDDASFSLGLTLSFWSTIPLSLRILNFFTQSVYAPHSSAITVEEISALRQGEDQKALAFISSDMEVVSLGLLDAPERLHLPFSEITQEESARKISPEELSYLSQCIQQHCRGSLAIAPLSLGHHVDHMAVHRAAVNALLPHDLAFYEDLPYLTWTTPADLQRRIESVETATGVSLEPFVVRRQDAVKRKRQIGDFYASQITGEEADAIARYAEKYGNGERLWLPVSSEKWNAVKALATAFLQTAIQDPPRSIQE